MAGSIGPRRDRVPDPVWRQGTRLSPRATTLLIAILCLLCWLLLIFLGKRFWSVWG